MGFIAAGALAFGLVLLACEDNSGYDPYSRSDPCAQYTSCGECTPVLGCGWCANFDGTGACADEPNDCNGVGFTWAWEPSGCLQPADASVVMDGAPPVPDSGPTEAAAD